MKLKVTVATVTLAGMMALLPGAVRAQQSDTAGTEPPGELVKVGSGVPDTLVKVEGTGVPDTLEKVGASDTRQAHPTNRKVGQPQYQRRPRIQSALRALSDAREDLQNAAHTFGGHRVNAIRAIDTAIAQLKLALKYDRTH
jgi:hypothetical protein